MSKNKNKKFNTKLSVVSNLVIMVMLLTILSLTVQFESQYVFGFASDEAIYHGNQQENEVSLMVNVYWGNEYLAPMLEILNNYGVKTTFFVGGSWAEKNAELLKTIVEQGHEIGNHGYFHKDHKNLNYDQNQYEISVTHTLVKQLTGINMNLFAPPSGSFNKTTLKVANELGYKTVMWSADTIDWRDKDANLIFTRATKNIKGGDLVLMHPTQHTVMALERILKFYQTNHLVATTVTNVLN